MDSILDSIKTLLGIEVDVVEDPSGNIEDEGDTNFDAELIMHINSVFSILHQLGVGSAEAYKITSRENVWSEFLGTDLDLELVKSYIYLKVRLIFDPPQNSFLVKAIESQLEQFEWRLQVQQNHTLLLPKQN